MKKAKIKIAANGKLPKCRIDMGEHQSLIFPSLFFHGSWWSLNEYCQAVGLDGGGTSYFRGTQASLERVKHGAEVAPLD